MDGGYQPNGQDGDKDCDMIQAATIPTSDPQLEASQEAKQKDQTQPAGADSRGSQQGAEGQVQQWQAPKMEPPVTPERRPGYSRRVETSILQSPQRSTEVAANAMLPAVPPMPFGAPASATTETVVLPQTQA